MMDKFVFGNVDTENYRAYVFPKEIDNVPVREYEEITIPGRNGTYVIDHGRYENVEHIYDVVLKSDTAEADYIRLKNELMVQTGYQKLSDTIAPGEYYEARLTEITTPVTTIERDGIKFEVVFDRKPQRMLVSGDTAIPMEATDVITNPTLFDSSPLLLVNGYGDVTLGDKTVSIVNTTLGKRKVGNKVTDKSGTYWGGVEAIAGTATVKLDTAPMSAGDKIWFGGEERCRYVFFTDEDASDVSNVLLSSVNNLPFTPSIITSKSDGMTLYYKYNDPKGASCFFRYGTSETKSENCTLTFSRAGTSYSIAITLSISYNGDDTIQTMIRFDATDIDSYLSIRYTQIPEVWARTTLATSQEDMYIDLEDGMAYVYVNGEYISVNSAVWLGARMPILPPGDTDVSYSGHIHSLKIIPRWWTL